MLKAGFRPNGARFVADPTNAFSQWAAGAIRIAGVTVWSSRRRCLLAYRWQREIGHACVGSVGIRRGGCWNRKIERESVRCVENLPSRLRLHWDHEPAFSGPTADDSPSPLAGTMQLNHEIHEKQERKESLFVLATCIGTMNPTAAAVFSLSSCWPPARAGLGRGGCFLDFGAFLVFGVWFLVFAQRFMESA
jgi:hypothetical protein